MSSTYTSPQVQFGRDLVDREMLHDEALTISFATATGELRLRLAAHDNFDALKAKWLALEASMELSPFQSFDWCREFWHSGSCGPKAKLEIIAGTADDGSLALLMPLMTVRRGGVLVAEMINDTNAAHRAPVIAPSLVGAIERDRERRKLFSAVRKLTGADVLLLEQQPVTISGAANPFLSARAFHHGEDIADALFVQPTWEEFDRAHRSSKSRARDRKRIEGLSSFGPVSYYIPQTLPERQAFLTEILDRKTQDLKSRGVDFFENPATRNFLMRIAALDAETSTTYSDFVGLRVGDQWAAAHFGVIHGKIGCGLIIAMGMPEARQHSPGHVLLLAVLKHLLERGLSRFSFGLGESDLKTRWTDERVAVASEAIALSPLGLPFAALKHSFWWAKRETKQRPQLFEAASRARAFKNRVKALVS